jgi:DNA-binding IclR family transcriptional regulator
VIFRVNDLVSIWRTERPIVGRIVRVTGKAVMLKWKDRYGRVHISRMVPDQNWRHCAEVPAGYEV